MAVNLLEGFRTMTATKMVASAMKVPASPKEREIVSLVETSRFSVEL